MGYDVSAALKAYTPWNEQEARDRDIMLAALDARPDPFTRENEVMHFSASSWIVNRDFTKVLMAYHNIYQAWAWTGGHADGERDLLAVAVREAREETGVHAVPMTGEIFSLEILTVDGHEKRGRYVPSHLHLNVTYLLAADENEALRSKADENAAVRWFTPDEALNSSVEKWMVQRVYSKLNQKAGEWKAAGSGQKK
ncbi:MAG: NUDIX hydrolase [Clostridia bacterium]|nr:NUDIX hydrolase [Clostridia bacterium]